MVAALELKRIRAKLNFLKHCYGVLGNLSWRRVLQLWLHLYSLRLSLHLHGSHHAVVQMGIEGLEGLDVMPITYLPRINL